MMRKIIIACLLICSFGLSNSSVGVAQNATKDGKAKKQTAKQIKLPSGVAMNILIRRTLLSLNDANLTGNYTVFRDLAAPDFRRANDAAKLAGIFSQQRNQRLDFAPVLLFDPKLIKKPELTKGNLLRVTGFMPTKPLQLNFDMLFQKFGRKWLLYGISVQTSQKVAANSTATKQVKKKDSKAVKKKAEKKGNKPSKK